jgi:hypothetical protein
MRESHLLFPIQAEFRTTCKNSNSVRKARGAHVRPDAFGPEDVCQASAPSGLFANSKTLETQRIQAVADKNWGWSCLLRPGRILQKRNFELWTLKTH